MEQLDYIKFTINGTEYKVKINDVDPETRLNTYLRDTIHLTGTKKMCFEGGCGTCTIAVEHTANGKRNTFSAFSCLVPLLSCHGWNISTVEGIGNPIKGYHQIQKLLTDNYGTQCGFCSSGMVMNMYALQKSGAKTQQEIENSFGGNICRCTGYRPILKAFKQLASDADEKVLGDIEELKICPSTGQVCTNKCKSNKPIMLELGTSRWIKATSLADVLSTLKTATTTNYMLVCGNTAKGVFKTVPPSDLYIDIQDVPELSGYTIDDTKLTFGANVNLTQLMNICKENSKKKNFSFLDTIEQHLQLVATVQIRNVASVAGNLMMKFTNNEFQSDIFVLLETFNATLVTVDVDGNETSSSPQNFLNRDMKKQVLKGVVLNALDSSYKFASYKIMPRAQNAHAIVNAGFLMQIQNDLVKSANIVYGAINPKFIHATETEKLLIGKKLYDNSTLQNAITSLEKEIVPDHVPPEPTPEFRKSLAISLFYKFVLNTCPENLVDDRYKTGGSLLSRPISSGTQQFGTNEAEWPLTQPIPKLESLAQCSGQAEYIMDIPPKPNEAYCAFVTAEAVAGSTVLKIDASKALALKGVIAYFDKNDIPGRNSITPIDAGVFSVEEELFCSGTVKYYHQPIGIIVAANQTLAWQAAGLVSVTYDPPKVAPYLNVKDVVRDNVKDRITLQKTIPATSKGNDVKKVFKGDFYLGPQYHYHMEVQSCKVVPTEDSIDIFPTTQWMDGNQIGASTVLNIPMSKINIKVRRLGGGFGGKMFRNVIVSTAAALAAFKLRIPITMVLSLEQNMDIIGKRYPTYITYEAGVNDTGIIQYLKSKIYTDVGCGGNEPLGNMLVDGVKNCYDVSTWEFSAYTVKTDNAANCYTRSPGTLEGTAITESIFEEIALALNLDPMQIKLANTNIPLITKHWEDLQQWANITKRKQEIVTFNKANRWRKQGISIVPLKWVLEVASNFTVLVSIFHGDGSVTISHGGIEMGQGINTKAAQMCAHKFGLTLDQIAVVPSYSVIASNAAPTGGSLTSEAICYAIVKACDTIIERMKPIKDKMQNPTWLELVQECYANTIQLNATGFYYGPTPTVQQYPVYAICSSTVEVDLLTGKHEILQVDIIEDLGESMSPLVDIGQIEGGFVMGLGYFTSEALVYDDNGRNLTNRTWTYKPPGAKDIPILFRIKFADKNINPVGILKSKAVAEPPTCLSATIPLAIRNALADARQEADPTQPKWIPFDGTTSVEKIFISALNNHKQYVLK